MTALIKPTNFADVHEAAVARLVDDTESKMKLTDESFQTSGLTSSTVIAERLASEGTHKTSLDVKPTYIVGGSATDDDPVRTSLEASFAAIAGPSSCDDPTRTSVEADVTVIAGPSSRDDPARTCVEVKPTSGLQLNGMIKPMTAPESDLLRSITINEAFPKHTVADNLCSHTLPLGNVISAVVASRWDDIMGPRTIRVWLPTTLSESLHTIDSASKSTNVSIKTACEFYCRHQMVSCFDADLLMKAIKYVTVHTNYSSISGAVPPELGGTSVLVVPALNVVSQSNLFHLPIKGSTPHSVALLIDYTCYEDYLMIRPLCNFWLLRLSSLLSEHLLLEAGIDGCPPSSILDSAIFEMCVVMQSLRTRGLLDLRTAQNLLSPCTLNLQVLGLALTSHLQTAGCTTVIGNSPQDINAVISFLALFLDKEARGCSRLLSQDSTDRFHVGLFLQGLHLNQVRGDFNSHDLAASPLPVTWVNLQRQSVYQSLPLHLHQVREINPTVRTVREEASLVTSFIRDISFLSLSEWTVAAKRFMRHVHYLAFTLLSLLHWSGAPSGTLHLNPDEPNGRPMNQIRKMLHLDAASALIVLAAAEQLKPGVYRLLI